MKKETSHRSSEQDACKHIMIKHDSALKKARRQRLRPVRNIEVKYTEENQMKETN